ncbi:uncharacterized protein LOC21393521 [Morus notabilis]|uniref:uncharacterized protein LOC21393521 n=1 Tax=Morus notabilis TaxID=981085 RepID=UPI000CED7001|nr:uncharacterized protein LOC21393521 [Morus notabilis]
MVKENKDFLVVLNEHLKKHNLICNEIFTALKASSDPAKLALHAMQGIYHLNSSAKNHKFGKSFVGRSCIVLSESLMKASSEINPQERNEAMKLARDWKAKIIAATENRFAVFSFLQFVASYGLASTIDANELRSLLDVVGLNGQALQLSSSICAVDKATDAAESIRNHIQRGETIHALRHICELKFTDKFPVEPVLTEYLEYAQNYTTIMFNKGSKYDEAKKKVKDKEEAALRAVAECNLESEFPIISLAERISKRVGVLEKMGQSVNLEVEQSKKRRNNNFALQGQQVRIRIQIPGIIGGNNDALCANSSGRKNAGMPDTDQTRHLRSLQLSGTILQEQFHMVQ